MSKKWKLSIWILAIILILLAILPVLFMPRYYNSAPPSYNSQEPTNHIPSSVDKALREMDFANIVFNSPSYLNIDDESQVHLVLSLGKTIQQLKEIISESGKKYGATIKISNRMEARLSGYKFQITAITPEVQAVSKELTTNWSWEIHPKEEGLHNLHLTLTALLDVNGHDTPRAIRTFNKEIEIKITTAQKAERFFTKNWQWLWAALIVPVAGWYWKKRNPKSEKDSK